MRLDALLVDRGFVPSRARARDAIRRGLVTVNGRTERRPGLTIAADAALATAAAPYVSRGGEKLAHALDTFAIDVTGCRAIDVGASTGGFTDVLLRRGAAAVIALDVGHSQLAPALCGDPRVTELSGVNARHIGPPDLPYPPDFAVFDVSFISLRLVVPPVLQTVATAATLVALVKPQFEVGRDGIGKGGIVRDEGRALAAVETIAALLEGAGLRLLGRTPSPIKGGDGNAEWLIAAARP